MQSGYEHLPKLEATTPQERLALLSALLREVSFPAMTADTNNHIHTTYSFSPYSPAAAAFMARMAGLCTAGLMDHDTMAGSREFLAAADMCGIASTIGMEFRVSFAGTPFAERKVNNPDQAGCVYMAYHAVPHAMVEQLQARWAPFRQARGRRNARMVEAINRLMGPHGIVLQYETDVVPLSQQEGGGSVTERHIAKALALALCERCPAPAALVSFLKGALQLSVSDKAAGMLLDGDNPFRLYDLIGLIKSDLIARFYIDATEECPAVLEAVAYGLSIGAIPAYPYLGDVSDSVTGDKRTQRFEDEYLDELIAYVASIGVPAVTYMPARNTRAQTKRLQELCVKHGLLQISGEDINQPRQSFICPALREEMFAHLADSARMLVEHERR